VNNYYQIYINSVLELAQTIVIKSIDSVTALNQYITDTYGKLAINLSDPSTWKYYLNISGEYHPTDKEMFVVSLDTLELIKFTKANLLIHKATARTYRFGTRLYSELLTKYPDQEMLIKGILYPVDIQKAIAAKDGAILTYPKHLVEANEYSLIGNLQKWINIYKLRWTNNQYSISDELYSTTSLGIMYLNLIPAILTFRLDACKTNEAHSFHVKQYLASHGLFDTYLDKLTNKQLMFFYRNIAYIERNIGQRYIFEWLIEHIMTERSLPIAEYTMRHDLENQLENIYPELRFRRKAINPVPSASTIETISLEEMLVKQDRLARDNIKYKDAVMPVIKEQLENSLSNAVMTKVLESSIVDYGNSSSHSLTDTLLNQWLDLSSKNVYNTNVEVTNPKNGEKIPLSAKDAYTFIWYAFCKSINVDIQEVPKLLAKRVQNI
jgi:hypothetical protein